MVTHRQHLLPVYCRELVESEAALMMAVTEVKAEAASGAILSGEEGG